MTKLRAMKILFLFLIPILSVFLLNSACFSVRAENSFDQATTVYEKISKGFYSFEKSIDLLEFNVLPSQLGEIFSSIIKNDPYLFFVSPRLSFSYRNDGKVLSIRPAYKMTAQEAEEAIIYCKQRVGLISGKTCENQSDLEKALFLHDYLVENFEYDVRLQNDGLYDFFKFGSGTCQAYTLAYIALLRECGIKACFVASDTIEHIWTLAEICGRWYHVDVTWDDPMSSDPQYRHFLCSDKASLERGHKDWYMSEQISCTSQIYDTFDFNSYKYSCALDLDHSGETDLTDLIYLRFEDTRSCSFCLRNRFVFCRSDEIREKILTGD